MLVENTATKIVHLVELELFWQNIGLLMMVLFAALSMISNSSSHMQLETTAMGIEKFKGSKYVQSEIGYIYSEVRELLVQGKKVLFFGAPRQLAGLYSIVGRNFDNLVTVEILCHGVSPDKYFQEELEQLKRKEYIHSIILALEPIVGY